MPQLASPHLRYQRSFLMAVQEFRAAGESERLTGLTVIGEEHHTVEELTFADAFESYTQRLHELAMPDAPRPEGMVPMTTMWWVDGDEYLGRLSIRHELTEWLLEVGGHIGYLVRPSARNHGHATAMLAASLPITHTLGIDPALLTCDDTNAASRRVIEANGGVFEDQRENKLRFWVPTST